MSSNLYLMLILQSPHCCTTTGRHGILVRDWMLDHCTRGLLGHVRLSTGVGPPNSSLFVESESEYLLDQAPWSCVMLRDSHCATSGSFHTGVLVKLNFENVEK